MKLVKANWNDGDHLILTVCDIEDEGAVVIVIGLGAVGGFTGWTGLEALD